MDKNNKITSSTLDRELGVIAAFSEVVAAGVKQLALSSPMSPAEMDEFEAEAKKEAAKYGVSVFREKELIITDLFPADVAKEKDVLLLFKGKTKAAYMQLKADQKKLQAAGKYDQKASREISRRFGRLLSYTPKKINQLLAQNTNFRTLSDFGIKATNLFLYYEDLKAAGEFYTNILGMELVADYKMAQILRMTKDSYLILVDAKEGMHTAKEPKTVALALLTDQLKGWYEYLKEKKVPIKYKYKEGAAHDGFVAVDPEGYLLEFERFNQHWENEKFMPILAENKSQTSIANPKSEKPANLNIHSTITWLYHKDVLKMQHFYENTLGLELVADQGWTKIYQASNTGFMAIVDGKRGMHTFTEKKAVNVGIIVDDLLPWFDYVKANELLKLRESEVSTGPETRYKAFVGYGPEDYYWEFDAFFPHEDNELLLKYLGEE
jgi:catechol 2,3-dioxygenase-like lactoylglutathione lyase family enzyme